MNRAYTSRHYCHSNTQRSFLDGRLLWQYLHLSAKEKVDFAKQIGTSPAQVCICKHSTEAVCDATLAVVYNFCSVLVLLDIHKAVSQLLE